MATWVLIALTFVGYGGRPFPVFQEFTTKEHCEAAGLAMKKMYASGRDHSDNFKTWECVPK